MLKLTEINGLLEYANSIKEALQCEYDCVVVVTGQHLNNGYTMAINLFDNNGVLYRSYSTGINNNYISYLSKLQYLKERIKIECFGV